MNIAICDDDKSFLIELKSKMYDYSNLHNWESVVYTYESGFDLVNAKTKFDIIILDFQMNQMDGIETARKLRNGINQFSCIIFLTSYPEIAIPAYSVDTYRFVVKNTLYTGLYKALDDFRNIKKIDYDISIKHNNEYLTINTERITFIEVQNKCCFLHLSTGQILSTNRSLSQLYKEVPHTHFFKIHKSFVINFKYISERGINFVKIINYQHEIPISRNYASTFKKKYYNYLKSNTI